jgi:predicted glycosyltransferase
MRIWIDLANSPHVALFGPVAERLRQGGEEVVLSVRDHAQTLPLAREVWPDVAVVGGPSPPGRVRKAASIVHRAAALRSFAARSKPDVALSHGSYAQIVAARAARIPAVTMMDYEHQPANHVSFRLATRVILPGVFPDDAIRRFGAAERKVVRYHGFKEQLYLAEFRPDTSVLEQLGLDPARIIIVMRPPAEGALYHPMVNDRFEQILELALQRKEVEVVLLPRTRAQAERYDMSAERIHIPDDPVDGRSLLAFADLTIGAGGTMNRESAILGTPTYTVFAGELAAVDAQLIREGRLTDLRDSGLLPRFEKKDVLLEPQVKRGSGVLDVVVDTVLRVAGPKRARLDGRTPSA